MLASAAKNGKLW